MHSDCGDFDRIQLAEAANFYRYAVTFITNKQYAIELTEQLLSWNIFDAIQTDE